MKKISTISLVSILLINGAGIYVYFYLRMVEIKKEMRAEIAHTSPELFQRIILPIQDFNDARESDDELEWNDSMYDIATIKIVGQQVEVLALRDELETNLLAFASEIMNCASHDSKSPPAALTQYLSLSFTPPFQLMGLEGSSFTTIVHNTHYNFTFTGRFGKILAPPPRG